MAGPQLRRAQTAAEATAAPPRLCRTWSVPRPSRRSAPGLCLELPWGQVSALPCFHALRGQVEVVAEVLPQLLSKEEVAQVQFRCHRAKFAAPLLGFALREGADGGTMLFYARPDGGFVADLEHLAWRQRLLLAHGAAAALWNLHALGFGCRVAPERLGISEGRAALLVGLEPARQEDVEQLGHLLVFLLTQGTAAAAPTASRELLALARNEGDDILEGLPWPRDEAQLLAHLAGVCFRQGPLQRVVTLLAERLRSEAAAPAPGALALRKPRWALLRHVLRACWAFQQGLEALCCVCLERQRKSLGLMCPTNHRYRLLCGSCLEPYVCSLIGTAELRRNKGGVACPACSASKGAQVFSKDQVQDRLVGQALRRFVEATKEEEEEDLEDDEAELSVLVEDLTTRRVRVVTHCRTFESEEPQVLRRSKQVLPYTWLRCQDEEEFFQYDPATMGLRQHMSSRLFCLQVAELVTLRCPSCGAFLDPDPDGCVAMTCLACNEGFCWVCFRACGQDAHPHALEVHGTYFPCPAFITAWHRKLRWQSVQEVLRQLMEDSQASALAESRPLLNDVQLWPFPAEAPKAPLAAPVWDGEEVEGAAPRQLHLHEAARFGQMERLQELLEQNVEVNERNERGMTPLCFAVHEGRSEAIRLLLARAADPNMADDHGVTPLHYACREPPFPILEDIPGLLLGYPEVEANRQDHTGSSAIVVAAEVGRAEVVPALLRCERLDPNLTNHQSRTALLVAAAFDHTEVVAHLLASPRVEVTRRSVEGETPLHLAAKRGAKGTTQLLLQHPGTELNAVNAAGRTALMEAAWLGAAEVVECFLEMDAIEVELKDGRGCCALMLSACCGCADSFRQLLPWSRGLLNDRNEQGYTVLMMLAERGGQRGIMAHRCLQLLLEEASTLELNASCDAGTALMLAVRRGCLPSVEDLLAAGADTGSAASGGETASSLCSLWGSRPTLYRALRGLLPLDAKETCLVLFDGLLARPVQRVSRCLPVSGLEVSNEQSLTVEFESMPYWKWKRAGYRLHSSDIFLQEHEACVHEREVQRVNGFEWQGQELLPDDLIKLRGVKHVRRLEHWLQEGWDLVDGRFRTSGARRKVVVEVLEEPVEVGELQDFLATFQ